MRCYKGFDKEFKCRDFQFEVGKTYETTAAKLCASGFHACENPLDVLTYYPPNTSRYALVQLDGVSEERESDTKRCGTTIAIERELSHCQFIDECRSYLASIETTQQASGNSGHAQASGYSGIAVSLGRYGTATASGRCMFIVLADWSDDGQLRGVVVGEVGKNISRDKKYRVHDGQLVET